MPQHILICEAKKKPNCLPGQGSKTLCILWLNMWLNISEVVKFFGPKDRIYQMIGK